MHMQVKCCVCEADVEMIWSWVWVRCSNFKVHLPCKPIGSVWCFLGLLTWGGRPSNSARSPKARQNSAQMHLLCSRRWHAWCRTKTNKLTMPNDALNTRRNTCTCTCKWSVVQMYTNIMKWPTTSRDSRIWLPNSHMLVQTSTCRPCFIGPVGPCFLGPLLHWFFGCLIKIFEVLPQILMLKTKKPSES